MDLSVMCAGSGWHGPLLGLHQDITLAESVAFLWYLRHVSALGGTFCTSSLHVQRYWRKGPEFSTRGQFLRADLETDLVAHRRDRATPRVKWVKGHATMQHMREGTSSLWQLQANELGGRAGEERFASASVCQTVRTELRGSPSRHRETQKVERRGAMGAEAASYAVWAGGGVPTGTAKEEGHTRQVFAHSHAGEDWYFLVLLEVWILHRKVSARAGWTGVVASSKSAAECSKSSRRAGTQRLSEPVRQAEFRHVASADATKVGWDWCDVTREMVRDVYGVINSQSGTTLTSHSGSRNVRNFADLFGR